jgi:hypothetical protein
MRLRSPHNRSFAGPLLNGLLLLAFVARSLIPAGFMPDMAAGRAKGLFPLTICSAAGSSIVYVSGDRIPEPRHKPAHAAPCVFSALFACGTLPQPALVAAGLLPISRQDMGATGEISATGAEVKPWLSRGPPAASA